VLNNGAVLHEQPVSLIETGAITEGLLSVWRVQQNNEQPWLLMTATCSDELNEALDELRRLRTTHQLILNAAGEGIYGLDNEGRTTFGNAATMEILGWNPENIIGKKAHDVHHHSHPDGSPYPRTECPIYAALKDGEVHRVDNEVFWHTDGSAVPVEYTSTPIWQDGKINGAVVVFRDISERKEIERQREVEKANMLAALRHVDGRIWGSDGAAALLGLKPSTLTYRMKVFGIRNEDRAS
jgi:PAS domain S-box-containing protein